MSDLLVNAVGVAAAACAIASFAPQVLKIARERDASAVSLRTYVLTCTCFVLWTAYGVMTEAWPITVSNALALCMAASVLFLKWKFRDGPAKGRAGK